MRNADIVAAHMEGMGALKRALEPLAAIADAYDECSGRLPDAIVLVRSGGRRLLTLEDCLEARRVLERLGRRRAAG